MIAGHLKNVLAKEGIAFEEPALMMLGKAAAGSFRDSLSLLDQAIAHGGGKVGTASVGEMLGSMGGDLVWPLMERLAQGDGKGVIAEADRIAARSISFDSALEELASILHRVALAQAGVEPDASDPDAARLTELASSIDSGRVQVMYQVALVGRRDLPLAPDEYAGFTMALLRMISFATNSGEPRAARPVPAETRRVDSPTPAARTAAPAPAVTPPVPSAAPAKRESPPATRESAATTAVAKPGVRFEGDWPAFVRQLELTGMAGMAARFGEVASFGESHLELVVPEAHKMYTEKPYVDKLKAELAPYFSSPFRLTVRAGATAGTSLAATRSREEAKKQSEAAGAIEEDPFVRELVRDLGAEVVPSSIRPADDAAGQTNGKR